MATDEQLRRAIIDTQAGREVRSSDPDVRRVVRETKEILRRGDTVDLPAEIEPADENP